MNNEVLVSIIIPAYNTERYIEETVLSALQQTHSKLEVIVVDDGSTDSTAQIVEELCNKNPKLILIRQNNLGVSVARNTGFAASTGSYIAYLDADDVWMSENITSKLAKFNLDESYGLVHSDAQAIDSKSQKIDKTYRGYEGYLLDNLLLGQEEWIPSPSSILVKREVVNSVGGFDSDLSNGADQEFFFRVANKYKIGRVNQITWYYRIHPNNMHKNISLIEKDALIAYKKADQNKLFKNTKFRKRCYSNMYYMLAGSFWNTGKHKLKAIRYLINSIFFYPPVILNVIKKTVASQTEKQNT